jgi:hypothetical protein
LEQKLVPVDYQDCEVRAEIADMIADNTIAELADLDRSLLRDLAEHGQKKSDRNRSIPTTRENMNTSGRITTESD